MLHFFASASILQLQIAER